MSHERPDPSDEGGRIGWWRMEKLQRRQRQRRRRPHTPRTHGGKGEGKERKSQAEGGLRPSEGTAQRQRQRRRRRAMLLFFQRAGNRQGTSWLRKVSARGPWKHRRLRSTAEAAPCWRVRRLHRRLRSTAEARAGVCPELLSGVLSATLVRTCRRSHDRLRSTVDRQCKRGHQAEKHRRGQHWRLFRHQSLQEGRRGPASSDLGRGHCRKTVQNQRTCTHGRLRHIAAHSEAAMPDLWSW